MKKTRIFAWFLALALLSATTPTLAYRSGSLLPQKNTYTTSFADTKGTWCENYAKTVYEVGLMNGTTVRTFSPQGYLSCAQIVVITARLHSLLNGGKEAFSSDGGAWYSPYYSYLEKLAETNTALQDALYWVTDSPNNPCDRYDFVWLLHAVLPSSALTAINSIQVLSDVDIGNPEILSFYNAGILNGTDEYGSFHGSSTLNRGQAAAMLARLVDPSQRLKFTPKVYSYAQELLGLNPTTTVLTIDGYDISADLYAYALANSIGSYENENSYGYYDKYIEYYSEYLENDNYYDFGQFLMEIYGIDVLAESAIDWNAPDQAGLTPAEKVQSDALDIVTQVAELFSHQSQYPLTNEQESSIPSDLKEALSLNQYYGFSKNYISEQITAQALIENASKKYAPAASENSNYLAQHGYFYGRYIAISYSDDTQEEGDYDQLTTYTKEEARAAIEEVRQLAIRYQDDSEYFGYLIWKYSSDGSQEPDLIAVDTLSNAIQTTLQNLAVGSISPVIEYNGVYYLFARDDPNEDDYIVSTIGSLAVQVKLYEWAQDAQVVTSEAYRDLRVATVAQRYENLPFNS